MSKFKVGDIVVDMDLIDTHAAHLYAKVYQGHKLYFKWYPTLDKALNSKIGDSSGKSGVDEEIECGANIMLVDVVQSPLWKKLNKETQ